MLNLFKFCSLHAIPFLPIYFSSRYGSVFCTDIFLFLHKNLGPVVQSVVSLTSSLRVNSLTVLADSIYNILIFFAEKM